MWWNNEEEYLKWEHDQIKSHSLGYWNSHVLTRWEEYNLLKEMDFIDGIDAWLEPDETPVFLQQYQQPQSAFGRSGLAGKKARIVTAPYTPKKKKSAFSKIEKIVGAVMATLVVIGMVDHFLEKMM